MNALAEGALLGGSTITTALSPVWLWCARGLWASEISLGALLSSCASESRGCWEPRTKPSAGLCHLAGQGQTLL